MGMHSRRSWELQGSCHFRLTRSDHIQPGWCKWLVELFQYGMWMGGIRQHKIAIYGSVRLGADT